MLKRVYLLILLILVSVPLAGCNFFKEDQNLSYLQQVSNNMREQKKYTSVISCDFSANDFEFKLNLDMDMDLESEKIGNIKYDLDLEVLAIYNRRHELSTGYFILKEDSVINYRKESSSFIWYKQSFLPSEFFDSDDDISNINLGDLFKRKDTVKLVSEKTSEDSTSVDVYEVTTSNVKLVKDVLGDYKNLLSFDIDNIRNIVYRISVDPKNNLIRSIDINLQSVFNSLDNKHDFKKAEISINYNNFNEVTFEIPGSVITNSIDIDSNYSDPSDNYIQLDYESNITPLDYIVVDSIVHPYKPIIYAFTTDNKLVSINYETKETKEVSFNIPIECLTYQNNKVFVALSDDSEEGSIALVDASTLTVEYQFDINVDPYDIEVDNSGYIYISSNPSDIEFLKVYNLLGLEVDSTKIKERSIIKWNDSLDKIYTISRYDPRYIESYVLKDEILISGKRSLYEDHRSNGKFAISPDDKYIFNYSGFIYNCNSDPSVDLTVQGYLGKGFRDIVFDLDNNQFYTLVGKYIYIYDYTTFEILGYYQAKEDFQKLYHNNQNQLVNLYYDNGQSIIEVMGEDKSNIRTNEDLIDEGTFPEIQTSIVGYNATVKENLNYIVSDSIIHPTEPIIYLTSNSENKLFAYNIETNQVQQLSFNLSVEKATYYNDKLYILLIDYTYENSNKIVGSVAVVDPISLNIEYHIPINDYPYDIAVNNDNLIITSKTNYVHTYDLQGSIIDSMELSDKYSILVNPVDNLVYLIKTTYNYTSLSLLNISNGKITSPEHISTSQSIPLKPSLQFSPDGQYIFSSCNILLSNLNSNNEMELQQCLPYSASFVDFNLGKNEFYSIYNNNLLTYNYNSYELKEVGSIDDRNIHYFYYRNGKFITITKDTTYSDYKLNIYEETDYTIIEPNQPPIPIDYEQKEYESEIVSLNFNVKDSIVHTDKPIIYALDYYNNLFSINYETKEIKKFAFDKHINCITYQNDKIFVALSDSLDNGSITIINADTLTFANQFDIDIDPYDIEVDTDEYIYISNNSKDSMKVYTSTGFEVEHISFTYRSYIELNDVLNKIYIGTTETTNTMISSYTIRVGEYVSKNNFENRENYEMNTYFEISPDGKHIFNSSGYILNCNFNSSIDLTTKGYLEKEFKSIAFDLDNNQFYIAVDNYVYIYDYTTLEILGYYNGSGPIVKLYHNNQHQLVNLHRNNGQYVIEIMNPTQ